MPINNKRITAIVLIVALLLLIPFLSMQFSDEVKWTFADFAGAAFLLLGTGLLCELVWRKVKTIRYRVA
ncbi:MAG: hypothetical protein ABI688_12215, partial [Bacteroidota bacterium]